MRLHLIRHAESAANVLRKMDTALPGPALTDLGWQQAQSLARELADLPVSAVYASQALRARQTATAVADMLELEVQVIDGVHEVFVGELEGRSDRAAIEAFLEVFGAWTRGDLTVAMPGGETGQQVRDRVISALDELRAKNAPADNDGVVVVVSHGGAIRLGAQWLCDNVRPEVADREMIPNVGAVELETIDGGGWRCLRWSGLAM